MNVQCRKQCDLIMLKYVCQEGHFQKRTVKREQKREEGNKKEIGAHPSRSKQRAFSSSA